MKKTLFFLPILLLLLSGCRSETQKIEHVAYKYAYAMANYNVDDAEKYASAETMATITRAREYITKVVPGYIESDTPAKIEITKVCIVDDTTAYTIYHKTTPLKDFSDTLWVKKEVNCWKAHAPIMKIRRPANDSIDTTER